MGTHKIALSIKTQCILKLFRIILLKLCILYMFAAIFGVLSILHVFGQFASSLLENPLCIHALVTVALEGEVHVKLVHSLSIL